MKIFSKLTRKQKIAWFIVGGVVFLAVICTILMFTLGRGQVVVNSDPGSTIPEPETVVPLAPIGDSSADIKKSAVIYCADSNYKNLVASVREVSSTNDITLEEAVVKAVLSTPSGNGIAAVGASDIQLLSLELSKGVATVNLSIDARRLDSQRMHILRAAIVNSLLELGGIDYVNVLIDDREECIIQLPAGTMSRFDNDLDSEWLQATTENQKYEDAEQNGYVLSRDVTLYFGATGGRYILPEVRSIRMDNADYLGGVLEQLFKGPSDTKGYQRLLPSGSDYMREKPEIVTAADGSKVAVISFDGAISEYFKRNDISTAAAFGSLARSVCGFVPEVEGVLCDIDGIMVKELYDGDGALAYTFDDGIMRRGDFDSMVGEVCTIYYPTTDYMALKGVDVAMSRYEVENPRALLNQLMYVPALQNGSYKATRAIPSTLTDADVLGVRIEAGQALINLSGTFYQACQSMTADQERAMIYSIVNTMCELTGVKSVRFYFDGERVDYMAGGVYLRGPLIENAGMVRG